MISAPATGSPGTYQDLTGKRLVYGYFAVPASNDPVTVRGQSINGYWPFSAQGQTAALILYPGWKIATFYDDTQPVVGPTNNVILFVGTEGQALDVALLFG